MASYSVKSQGDETTTELPSLLLKPPASKPLFSSVFDIHKALEHRGGLRRSSGRGERHFLVTDVKAPCFFLTFLIWSQLCETSCVLICCSATEPTKLFHLGVLSSIKNLLWVVFTSGCWKCLLRLLVAWTSNMILLSTEVIPTHHV